MTRLTAVELRKATDTLAGFWLLLATAAITLAAAAILLMIDKSGTSLQDVLSVAVQPAGVLLPIVGILLVTSEWSQRTALITFTLVPARLPVLAAKLLASVLIALAATVAAIVVSVLGTAAAGAGMTLSAAMLGQMVLYSLTAMLTGVALGALLQSSAPAIVASFAAPLAITALASIPQLKSSLIWIDQARTLGPLTDDTLSATEWAHAATTLVAWLAIPLAIGAWRLAKGEIR